MNVWVSNLFWYKNVLVSIYWNKNKKYIKNIMGNFEKIFIIMVYFCFLVDKYMVVCFLYFFIYI